MEILFILFAITLDRTLNFLRIPIVNDDDDADDDNYGYNDDDIDNIDDGDGDEGATDPIIYSAHFPA